MYQLKDFPNFTFKIKLLGLYVLVLRWPSEAVSFQINTLPGDMFHVQLVPGEYVITHST